MSCKDNAINPALVSGIALIVVGGLLLLSQMYSVLGDPQKSLATTVAQRRAGG